MFDRIAGSLERYMTLLGERQKLVASNIANADAPGYRTRDIDFQGEFRSLLEYKAAWYGREVVVVDRFFPSSKLCSACGTLQEKMPLNVRTWTCDCGTTHDRDVNAAKNLLAAGRAVAACGAGVRPQRSSPGGQSAMKQEVSRREP